MTPDQIEAERVAFEASMLDRYGLLYFNRNFEADWIQDQWRGWLARAELIHVNQQAAEELMERQESQRVRMAEKHERGE
jgi:hypothetical protein